MKLTNPQLEISNSTARFRVAACGRRFGKSYLAINELAKFSRYPNRKCMAIFPSYRMGKQIVWDDLKAFLRQKRWVKKVNESELTITLVNGSQILIRSADNPDSIRGVGLDFVVIDEAADIPKLDETWRAVIRPTLSDREGHALIVGSPKGRNFFYDLHNTVDPDWKSWQFTTLQGENVSEEEVEAAKKDLDERTFKQEYLAEWVDYSGLIYYAFGEHNLCNNTLPGDLRMPIHIGGDFNIDPMYSVLGYQTTTGLHIFDEIEIWGSNTDEMAREIQLRYPGRKIIFYPDAAGQARKTSANGITDHIILKNAGFELRVGQQNPAVKDRIAAVNSAFRSKDGAIKLTIDPKCVKLIEALRKHTYKDGTQQPDKGKWDHYGDALGYLTNSLYPIRQNMRTMNQPIRRTTGAIR